MSAMPPTTPPTIAPIGALELVCEPIVGRFVEDAEEPCVCVGLMVSADAVPCPNPPTGTEKEVSVPPTTVTGAVSVIELVPPAARTRV